MHEIRPGARIDPSEIASEFGMSVTPPRDALHMLVGEGLAEIRHGEGFFVPEIDEQGLKDLYDWNLDLILAAWRRGKPTRHFPQFGRRSHNPNRGVLRRDRSQFGQQTSRVGDAMGKCPARCRTASRGQWPV